MCRNIYPGLSPSHRTGKIQLCRRCLTLPFHKSKYFYQMFNCTQENQIPTHKPWESLKSYTRQSLLFQQKNTFLVQNPTLTFHSQVPNLDFKSQKPLLRLSFYHVNTVFVRGMSLSWGLSCKAGDQTPLHSFGRNTMEVTVSSEHQRVHSVILSITDDGNFYLSVKIPLLFSGSPVKTSDCSTCNKYASFRVICV